MAYYEVVVIPVRTDRKDDYLAMARTMADALVAEGATDVVDLWGSDVPPGKVTSFPQAVQADDGETVAVGWIGWPSKAARDTGWEAVMAAGVMPHPDQMPFDAKRMFFGGFDLLNAVRQEG